MNIDVRINIDIEVNQTQREALIREYERRIAVLKSGGSPSAVTFRRGRTAESEITDSGDKTKCRNSGDGMRTISSEWTDEDIVRNCVTEMFRTFTKNAKDGGCIVLTEDDLREDERPVLGQGMIIEMEKPLRVNIRAAREGLPITIPMKGAETRLEAALRAVKEVKKVYHDAEICVEVGV